MGSHTRQCATMTPWHSQNSMATRNTTAGHQRQSPHGTSPPRCEQQVLCVYGAAGSVKPGPRLGISRSSGCAESSDDGLACGLASHGAGEHMRHRPVSTREIPNTGSATHVDCVRPETEDKTGYTINWLTPAGTNLFFQRSTVTAETQRAVYSTILHSQKYGQTPAPDVGEQVSKSQSTKRRDGQHSEHNIHCDTLGIGHELQGRVSTTSWTATSPSEREMHIHRHPLI